MLVVLLLQMLWQFHFYIESLTFFSVFACHRSSNTLSYCHILLEFTLYTMILQHIKIIIDAIFGPRISAVWLATMSHHISRWATTSSDEPSYLLMSHHISRWATTSSDEPSYLPMNHHISRWATTSSDEPLHLPMSHHIFRWAFISSYEPPHFPMSHNIFREPSYPQWAITSLMRHHIFRWAFISSYEPSFLPLKPAHLPMSQHIFLWSQHMFRWATTSSNEPPHLHKYLIKM